MNAHGRLRRVSASGSFTAGGTLIGMIGRTRQTARKIWNAMLTRHFAGR